MILAEPPLTMSQWPEKLTDIVTMEENLISTAEAADIIGVNQSMIARYIREGRLKGFKIGGRWVIRRSDAENFERPLRGRPWHKQNHIES